MIRKLVLLLGLTALLIPALAQSPPEWGFEGRAATKALPAGWSKGVGKGLQGAALNGIVTLDSSVRHSGRSSLSLAIDHEDSVISVVHCIDRVLQARVVKLEAFIKTEKLDGNAVIWLRIDGEQTLAFNATQNQKIDGTRDWQRFELALNYDKSKAKRICFGAYVSGKGKIWVDDFRLTADGRELSSTPDYRYVAPKAQRDTVFARGSGIGQIPYDKDHVQILTELGAVWGFLKYHHPSVKRGDRNMDAALFRILPKIIAARDRSAAETIIERWVDSFGVPPACKTCTAMPGDSVTQRPDYGLLFDGILPTSLQQKLEYIRANRGDDESYYIAMDPHVGHPAFSNELEYASHVYPDAGMRLLALFRYWNMIRYFFPYQHLIGEDWDAVLPAMIPHFAAARDTAEYQRACLRTIARIHDTHAGLWGNTAALQAAKGGLITPCKARFLKEDLVITGFYKDTLGIKNLVRPGDIIERIDGVPVKKLIQRFLPLISASNYPTQLRELGGVNGYLLRGHSELVKLQVRTPSGSREVVVKRMPTNNNMWTQDRVLFRPAEGYRLLDRSTGYIYPALLSSKSLDSIKTMFRNTNGLIVDLRCYPSTFMPYTYGAWLKAASTPFARFLGGSTDWPGMFRQVGVESSGGGPQSEHYKGKLVVIVDATTQSNAEYTAMMLQTVPGAVTIGSTTSGADGNVSEITLPGGLSTWISGINVLYPDGTETQRTGVRIDHVMHPTPEGVRAGKDELLEAAIEELKRDREPSGGKQ